MLWVMHRRGVALGIGIGVLPVPLQMPAALWEQVVSWGPALLAGFPMAGAALGTAAYWPVHWGWAVPIRRERQRRLQSMAQR